MEINKIHNINCLEGMKNMESLSVDMILTDPPYNTGMVANNKNGKARLSHFFNDCYSDDKYQNLVVECCKNFQRLLKQDRCGYIFINWKSLGIWINCLEFYNLKVKNVIVWDKIVHGLNYQNYAHTYELIIFFVKGDFFPINKFNGMYKDVWHIQRKVETNNLEPHHETEKSMSIITPPLMHSSKESWIILDPFVGVGNIPLTCYKLNRNFIGFELNPEYHKIAEARLQNAMNQKKIDEYG